MKLSYSDLRNPDHPVVAAALNRACGVCDVPQGSVCVSRETRKALGFRLIHEYRLHEVSPRVPYAYYSPRDLSEDAVLIIGRNLIRPCHLKTYFSRVAREPNENGCILWMAGLDGHGYGVMSVDSLAVKAHQISWWLANGPMPEGLEPDHLCTVRHCVNAEHLEAVTHSENQRRIFQRMTKCMSGRHSWADQVPIITSRGGRECRLCRNETQRKNYRLRQEKLHKVRNG